MDFTSIIDKLLDMDPDPIPRFVLLKEFKEIIPTIPNIRMLMTGCVTILL